MMTSALYLHLSRMAARAQACLSLTLLLALRKQHLLPLIFDRVLRSI
jgi:hypothetical protein